MPTFLAITPVRTIKLPNRGTRAKPRACSPKNIPAPPGLVFRWSAERRGRSRSRCSAVSPYLDPRFRGGCAGLRQLDLHVDAGREVELHQRIDGLRRRLHDIEQPLVGPHLELLARLLVDVRRAVDGEFLNSRRQRDGTADQRTGAPRSISNVASRPIEHTVIEGLEANTDILRFHVPTDAKEPVPHRR